jgi:serine/threonine-protein kinase HipA
MQISKHTCLYCYEPLLSKEEIIQEFHSSCSKRFFNKSTPPLLNYTKENISELAEKSVLKQKTIPGVQPKLSVGTERSTNRLTIIGFLGEYILKPQTTYYKELPEIEDLTMHLAMLSNIRTAKHSLIRLKSGELAYLTKRMDRINGQKIHMEDMCQLNNRLTEHKYKGSHEQIAKIIQQYSENPGLDLINFYELVVFCFLTGNNDMHLKKFSLIKNDEKNYELAPAYDLVAAQLLVEKDTEELALTLNGKKKNIHKKDLIFAMKNANINDKAIENLFQNFNYLLPVWHAMINRSFLSMEMKENYHTMIDSKFISIKID